MLAHLKKWPGHHHIAISELNLERKKIIHYYANIPCWQHGKSYNKEETKTWIPDINSFAVLALLSFASGQLILKEIQDWLQILKLKITHLWSSYDGWFALRLNFRLATIPLCSSWQCTKWQGIRGTSWMPQNVPSIYTGVGSDHCLR